MEYTIYALWEGTEENIRYVGFTAYTGQERLYRHLIEAKANKNLKNHKENWLRKCIANNTQIGVYDLEVFTNKKHAWEAEKTWIEYLKSIGCKLTNMHEGGGGGQRGIKRTPEQRARISAAISKAQTGKKRGPHSEEHKRKIAAALKGKKFSKERKRNISIGTRKGLEKSKV